MLHDRWEEFGTDDFKPARKPRRKDIRKGRGFALIYADRNKRKAMIEKRNKTIRKRKKNHL